MTREFQILYRVGDGPLQTITVAAETDAAAIKRVRDALGTTIQMCSAQALAPFDWNQQVFSLDEARIYLRVKTVRTVQLYQEQGLLPARYPFHRRELDKCIEALRKQATRARAECSMELEGCAR